MKKRRILTTAAVMGLIGSIAFPVQAAPNTSYVREQSEKKGYSVNIQKISSPDELKELLSSLGIDLEKLEDCFKIIFPGCNIPGIGKPDTPETNVPETDTPETDAPEIDEPETDTPETDAPEIDEPETDTPEADAPEIDEPETDTPETDAPEIDEPETDAPEIDEPETDAPETDKPEIDIPETDIPNTPETDAPETDTPETDTPDSESRSYAEQVVDLVNAERAKYGLSALTLDKQLEAAALTRAKETEVSFSHTRPDGRSFSSVLTDYGISYRGSGENIAWGQQSPEAVVRAWMNSEGHRANILNSKFTKIGVGYYQNTAGRKYWTQLFIY